jgi:glyoxylase-like metal-dependent hydrolase (beta-lactamase superfamily II)
MTIIAVPIDLHLPPGLMGPEPVDADVRCFLVRHATGLVLVDTGLPGSAAALGDALVQANATWSDVSDIVLSHQHPDHVGGLPEVAALAPHARLWGSPSDTFPVPVDPLADGEEVRGLRVLATPGHTPGHLSLLTGAGALLVGDQIGTLHGQVDRAPAVFTSDAEQAEESLRRVASLGAVRVLPAHGPELDTPADTFAQLLGA